jgi:hypothetical protein
MSVLDAMAVRSSCMRIRCPVGRKSFDGNWRTPCIFRPSNSPIELDRERAKSSCSPFITGYRNGIIMSSLISHEFKDLDLRSFNDIGHILGM